MVVFSNFVQLHSCLWRDNSLNPNHVHEFYNPAELKALGDTVFHTMFALIK